MVDSADPATGTKAKVATTSREPSTTHVARAGAAAADATGATTRVAPSGALAPATPAIKAGAAPTLDSIGAAVTRFDGKACRAQLAALTSPPATDYRVAHLHALCEMVAGNCAGGTSELEALFRRDGTPPGSAVYSADMYCPLTADPATRLRRLGRRIDSFSEFDCDAYLAPARASAAVAATDRDRASVGHALLKIAVCFSHRGQCSTARTVLAEAQGFIPALALNELNAQCR